MLRVTAACIALVALMFCGVALAHPEPNDLDGDNVVNAEDNCPLTPNGNQLNTDGDAEGDNCDADDDNDGVADAADNCRVIFNPGQENTITPGDNRGDACPPIDTDADGLFDEDDNCDAVQNLDQRDLDGDDFGDVCDRDDDGDRYDDGFDNCPVTYNPDQGDLDGDKVGSACDALEAIAGPAPIGGATPAAADRTAPKVTVFVERRQRLADAGRALVVRVSCSEACSIAAELAAGPTAARRAGLGRSRVVLARGSWELAGAGRTYVFARWRPAAKRLKRGRRLQSILRVTATDGAGNRRRVQRAVELRR